MSTLLRERPRVQPDWREIARDWSPEASDEVEPFISPEDTWNPSPADEAWLVAFNAADAGEPAALPSNVPLADRERVYMAHYSGDRAGTKAREVREAREIGQLMGCAGSAPEPPAGYAPHQAQAYREGHALGGIRRIVEEAQFEAWVAHQESEAMAEHFGVEISDADVYPMGCMS